MTVKLDVRCELCKRVWEYRACPRDTDGAVAAVEALQRSHAETCTGKLEINVWSPADENGPAQHYRSREGAKR